MIQSPTRLFIMRTMWAAYIKPFTGRSYLYRLNSVLTSKVRIKPSSVIESIAAWAARLLNSKMPLHLTFDFGEVSLCFVSTTVVLVFCKHHTWVRLLHEAPERLRANYPRTQLWKRTYIRKF